jgi:quercetin dioxygenase-like cupin family protein
MITGTPVAVTLAPEDVAALPWQPCADWPGVSQKLLSSGPTSVSGLLRFDPGAGELLHAHSTGEHHVWVLSGRVRQGEVLLPAGSYVHVGPGVEHGLVDAGTGSVVLFVRELPG